MGTIRWKVEVVVFMAGSRDSAYAQGVVTAVLAGYAHGGEQGADFGGA